MRIISRLFDKAWLFNKAQIAVNYGFSHTIRDHLKSESSSLSLIFTCCFILIDAFTEAPEATLFMVGTGGQERDWQSWGTFPPTIHPLVPSQPNWSPPQIHLVAETWSASHSKELLMCNSGMRSCFRICLHFYWTLPFKTIQCKQASHTEFRFQSRMGLLHFDQGIVYEPGSVRGS